MSLYVAKVGIVKIKPEYVEQFGYLFNGEYNKVQAGIFDPFFTDYYCDETYNYGIKDISNWSHDNEKIEWIDKYKTSYENGVFTYGLSYNCNNGDINGFVIDFYEKVLSKITEEVIFKDSWCEPM